MAPLKQVLVSFLYVAASLAASNETSPDNSTSDGPYSYAIVLFPGFAPIDVFGPLSLLEMAAFHRGGTLELLAETLDPVSNNLNSSSTFAQSVVPSSTFDDFLSGGGRVDVLIVPGGPGVRVSDEEIEPIVKLVKETYPKVKYLITVCTGASIAARAGILDGKRATTNKAAWDEITAFGPDVEWVSPTRWVVDGNIWSSSGATSGMDLAAEFMKEMYGEELVEHALGLIEYTPHPQNYDPFAEMFDVPPSP